jgi:RNA polymerase sigma-70 factor (ECF subfamily)
MAQPTLCLLKMMALRFTTEPHGQFTDETLLARTAQGDMAALAMLYDRYAPTVLGITLKILQDRARAEDLLQETFWQVWQRASTYRPESGSVTGWLFQMARQLALESNGRGSAQMTG